MSEPRLVQLTIALLGAGVTAVGIIRSLHRFAAWQAQLGRSPLHGWRAGR